MKKLIACVLAASMLLMLLAGCGNQNQNQNQNQISNYIFEKYNWDRSIFLLKKIYNGLKSKREK